jgi:glycosyltransferase involved in cell wall biosynthesis
MRILWYFPFARPEEIPLACATARDDDEIVVQVIDRPAAPTAADCPQVTIRRDLADVDRGEMHRVAWMLSRAVTYGRRARARDRAARRLAPDLCHVHYLNRFTDPLLLRRLRSPIVLSVHDVVAHQQRLPGGVEHRLLAATYRRADALLVHHPSLRDHLVADFPVDPARVHVLPHQVFAYGRPVTPLPKEPNILLFGALRPNKGIDVLLDALPLLPDGLRVTIAGRGDSGIEARVRAAAATDPRLHTELEWITPERKSELFESATCVVLPYTEFASQSGVLHDAYAHGRPVIGTDVGALGASITEDRTGLVVSPASARDLADAVRQMVDDAHLLAACHRRTVEVAEERSPQVLGPRLRAIYQAL